MSIPTHIPIKDNNTLVRDTFSMGVINTNQSALNEAKRKHQIALTKLGDERRRTRELNTLRTEVEELKDLVRQLLEKK